MLVRASVESLPVAANSVDLIFTDPPYGEDSLLLYGWLAREALRVLKPGGFVIAMCGGAHLNAVLRQFDTAGLDFYWLYQLELTGKVTGIVWPHGNQRVHVSTRLKHYAAYSKGRALSRVCTAGKFVDTGGDKRYHVWGQDVASARYYIDCFSARGDLVLDPFVGGGTTVAACNLIGRRGLGFDLAPAALASAKKRLAGQPTQAEFPLFAATGVT